MPGRRRPVPFQRMEPVGIPDASAARRSRGAGPSPPRASVHRPSVRSGSRSRPREVGAMKVLVAYASKYGATEGIAERIGDVLRASWPRRRCAALQGSGRRDRVRRVRRRVRRVHVPVAQGCPEVRPPQRGRARHAARVAVQQRTGRHGPGGCQGQRRARGSDAQGVRRVRADDQPSRHAGLLRRLPAREAPRGRPDGQVGSRRGDARGRLPRLGRDRGMGGQDRRRTGQAAARA